MSDISKTEFRGILSRRFGVIEIAPGITATLEENVLDWMDPYFCGNPKAGEIKRGDENLVCTTRETTRGILNPILQDRFVPISESAYFSDVLSEVAGEDHTLSAAEISQKNLDEGMAKTNKPSDTHGTMTKEHLFGVTEGRSTPHLFSKNPDTEAAVNHHLKGTQEILEFFLKVLEEEKARLYEESLSYLNFISAENLFGLSAYFTHDGTPFSHNELDGTRRAIRMVKDILEGLEVFRKQFEKGEINESHPSVKKFLESPAGEYAHLGYHLGFGPLTEKEEEGSLRLAQFISKMSGLIAEANATRTADIIAESYKQEEDLTDLIKIDSPYGNTIFRWLDGEVAGFANSFISLDSLALAATGTLAGKALLSTAKGAYYGYRITKSLGAVRPFLPGGLGVTLSTSTFGGRLGVAALNVGWEIAKMRGYQFAGFKVGGREGMEFVGRAYMFAGGFLSAVEHGVAAKLADELLAYQAQRAEVDEAISGLVERVRVFVAGSGGVLKAKLVRKAASLQYRPDKPQVLRELQEMLEEAQKKLEAAAEKAKKADKPVTRSGRRSTPGEGVARLTEPLLAEASRGKVRFVPDVLRKMTAFVEGNGERQKSILSAVEKIGTGNLFQFKTTHTPQGTFLALREKSFQILFRQLQGGLFEIVDFTQR